MQLLWNFQVNATAQIFCKSKAKLSKLEIDSIRQILHSKEHLRRNIVNVQFMSQQSFRDTIDGGFMHLVKMTLDVNTKHLWETELAQPKCNQG